MKLITSCFNALKPWLDKDMYFDIKEKEENTHINSNWGKKRLPVQNVIEDPTGDNIIIEE